MPEFRRRYTPGATYFFTLVTCRRRPWLCSEAARPLLRQCIADEQTRGPFTIEALVLLPDHLHAIWRLPAKDCDYSTRWAAIKANFTRAWLRTNGSSMPVSERAQREGRRGVWQARFMEHMIRDEDDFIQHVEYIHYNPVKRGLVDCPHAWPWSTFHRYVKLGHYPTDWCCGDAAALRLPNDESVLE